MPIFLIFIFLPILEIALFLTMADTIGLGWTLLLCVGSALLGFFILQEQGLKAVAAARAPLDHNNMKLEDMFDGLCMAVAGGLLIVPGFFTDSLALLLLIPAIRKRMRQRIGSHFAVRFGGATYSSARSSTIIDAEYERVEEVRTAVGNDNNPDKKA
jgi:UPF0716 protein FxsA